MYILVKLIFQSYIPDEIDKTMLFKQRVSEVIYGKVYEYDRVFQMSTISSMSPEDFDSFLQMHGYPVKPVIVSITANPDDNADILATDEQIGWWDDGPHCDELRDIELKDMNFVLQEEDGVLEMEVRFHRTEDGESVIEPVLFMDKVTLRIPTDEELEDEEDWDDMDDNPDDEPDTDSAGFTEYDRYNPDDYETE